MYRYVFFMGVAIILAAYFCGMHVGREKCRANFAADTLKSQTDIVINMEKINAETVRRGVDDIRRILRGKYTIAD